MRKAIVAAVLASLVVVGPAGSAGPDPVPLVDRLEVTSAIWSRQAWYDTSGATLGRMASIYVNFTLEARYAKACNFVEGAQPADDWPSGLIARACIKNRCLPPAERGHVRGKPDLVALRWNRVGDRFDCQANIRFLDPAEAPAAVP